jgi:exopolyphosphatase / guanosine-5'-triphosphate,3'-diphosphate pyrophosphatase
MTHRTGVIDLGSNTSRLVIYEHEPGMRFRLVDEVREVVRLREGMGARQVLRAAAIDRSLHALKMYRVLCDAVGVDDLIAVATSAVRDATNRDSFLSRVQSDAVITLRLLSGEQEGYYGALGAINGVGLADGFLVDMGGGSVQVVEIKDKQPGRAGSIQLGALHVAETYLGFDAAKPGTVKKLSRQVKDQLAEQFDWFKAHEGATLVAIGGTIRNLAAIAQSEDKYPLDSVDHYVLSGSDVRELGDRLWQLTAEERAKLGGLHSDRADIIHAGALVYSLLLEHSGFDAITVSRQGLREGLFYEKFLARQAEPVIAHLREFSVLNLARNFGQDTKHAHHVAFLCLRLFDDLSEMHELDPACRELLWAAAMLHDIGVEIGYGSHHLHSSYIVQNSLLPGYTQREKVLVALMTRYHRNRGSPSVEECEALLEKDDDRVLSVLSGMLRICEYLERGRRQTVRDVRCHFDKQQGWVQIEALCDGDAQIELWDARRNVGLLAVSLGAEIEIVEGVWVAETAAGA